MSEEEGVPVDLYIYDLSNGLANIISYPLLGRHVEGVWHTAVVVYDQEYFYGSNGISSCSPGSTMLGAPHSVQRLGRSCVPFQVFVEYIQGLSGSSFSGAKYHVLEHNCNHFCDEVVQFLCGARVPKHIVEQPERALSSEQREQLQALLSGLAPSGRGLLGGGRREVSPDFVTLNSQIEEARAAAQQLGQRRSTLAEKVARKERKRDKRKKKEQRERLRLGLPLDDDFDDDMAEALQAEEPARAGPSAETLQLEEDERRQEEQRKRSRHPPIVFKDLDAAHEYEALLAALRDVPLSAEEQRSLEELQQYLVQGEGSWVLGDDFLALVGRIVADAEVPGAAREAALRCLAAAALREDVSLVLHQARRDHRLLDYAYRLDAAPLEEQRALALFFCNLFEHVSCSEWLVYISEWEHEGRALSNIRVTTKVAVHALLAEDERLRDLGTALVHNLATKERLGVGRALRVALPKHAKSKVFDDVCVELAMALLQLLSLAPGEEHLYRACLALARLAAHSQDVPQLLALVGPSPDALRGVSDRVDQQIDLILQRAH